MGLTRAVGERKRRVATGLFSPTASAFLAATVLLAAVLTMSCGGKTVQSPASNASQTTRSSLTPQTAQVVLLGQLQFSTTVGSAGVTWSVNGATGGSQTIGVISNTGLYIAPVNMPSPNTVTVTATTSAQSASATITIVNPPPVISSLSPPSVPAGNANTTLTVTGTGFTVQSVVTLGGTPLATTYWNPTALTSVMTSTELLIAQTLPVEVITPTPGGGTSSAASLSITSGVFATINPQVALYSYVAPGNASVSIEFGPDTTYGTHTWAQTAPAAGGAVQILVAGMRANTTYHMRADVVLPDGTEIFDQDQTFITGGPQPSLIPQFTVTTLTALLPVRESKCLTLHKGHRPVAGFGDR